MDSSNAARPLEESGRDSVRAPLFALALEPFEDDRRRVVLDLGRARSGTIELFSRFRCRLDVIDLPASLEHLPDPDEPAEVSRWIDRLLPATGGERVDLVLCWNLLNYLSPALIEALGARLAERSAPGARLHALIEYSAKQMPARPLSFSPEDEEIGADHPLGTATIAAPRYTPKALEKRLPGFSSERTMLLGNGMQEFLYRRSSDDSSPPEQSQ